MSVGINVWYELMTTDTEAAAAFYTEVFGWTNQTFEGADPAMPYNMWMLGEQAVGGQMALPKDLLAMGVPPHWMAYTAVEDVDAAVQRATELGGKIHKEATDIPNVGRFAVLSDPQGAAFSVFRGQEEMPPIDRSKPGNFSWAELNTTDYEGAWKFYSALFGWKHRSSADMGPMGTYLMFQDPTETTNGGMCNVAKQMSVPPHWLYYVTVDDIDDSVERIKKLGGKILNGPMDIPGDDRIAQCMDPQGAPFAVYAEGKKKA